MSHLTKLKSNCHYCGYLCGFEATVEQVEPCERYSQGQRLVALEPDESRYPYNSAIVKGCRRWQMNLEQIDASERINYPLHRLGERGAGKWERVSWSEALDSIAARLHELRAQYGVGTLASAIGGPHASYWPLHRFMNLFGSPNNMGIGQICWNIRIWIDCLTYGWPIEVQIDPTVTGQVFLWGTNPADSDNSLFWRNLITMTRSGTPLVVIDPRRTKTARLATLHLAPRPGTDCYLALALIREIIVSGRANTSFVEQNCSGFDELVAHVEPYSLGYAERITGVAATDIAEAARLFSESSPTALLSGRGIDQLGAATAPTHRALSILRAITGDVDRAGACLIESMSDFIPEVDLEMSAWLSEEGRAAQLLFGAKPRLQTYSGYDGATKLTNQEGFYKRLPMRYLTSAHPNLVWRAALSGQPYKVTALICMGANPLLTYANTKLVYEAMMAMELIVVLEYYMTPTAALADYVLPSAGAFERPLIQAHGGIANFCYGGAAAVQPYYERRADFEVFRELGLRLGQEEHWPSPTLKDAIEATLAPADISWDDWANKGIYAGRTLFDKQDWEMPESATDSKRRLGYATTTGKIELANLYLEQLGAERLPVPVPPTADVSNEYPLIMITGARKQPYWASSYFNNAKFRDRYPDPQADMSANTMAKLGIKPGQWVEVATLNGCARFVATESELLDGVVSVDYGWWFPEEDVNGPNLGGIWRSNANLLTSGSIEQSETLIGSWSYNAIPCNVRIAP